MALCAARAGRPPAGLQGSKSSRGSSGWSKPCGMPGIDSGARHTGQLVPCLACMSVAQALTFPIEGYIRIDRAVEVGEALLSFTSAQPT